MTRRLALVALAAGLLGASVYACAGLLAPSESAALVLASLIGALLAGLWTRSSRSLLAASVGAGLALAAAVAWTQNLPQATQRIGLMTEGTGQNAGTGFLLAAGMTCLAAMYAWLIFRHGTPWPALALPGSLLLTRADVSTAYANALPFFLAGALLLVVGVTQPGRHLVRRAAPALALAGAVLFAAWHLPTATPSWSRSFVDPLARARDLASGGTASPVLSLLGPFRGSNQIVMSIRVNRADLRPYWRTTVFDVYDGQTWSVGTAVERSVPAGRQLVAPSRGPLLRASVDAVRSTLGVVSPGLPFRSSIPLQADYRWDGSPPVSLSFDGGAPPCSYTIEGFGAEVRASPRELAADLQLPRTPARVQALALELTSDAQSDLQRALRLESYLRNSGNFHYDAAAGSATGRDAVDDFLFRTRRGYCNQFASAMVVLAREVGIPARLVSGYATGTYSGGRFWVRERDAHSWAELYLPGLGWTSFEPTPGFSGGQLFASPASGRLTRAARASARTGAARPIPPVRTGRLQSHPKYARRNTLAPPPLPGAGSAPHLPLLLLAVVLGLLLALLAALYSLPPRSVAQIYRRMARASHSTRGPIQPHETPLEYAARWGKMLRGNGDAALIAELYAWQRYGAAAPSADDLDRARRAWSRLRRNET